MEAPIRLQLAMDGGFRAGHESEHKVPGCLAELTSMAISHGQVWTEHLLATQFLLSREKITTSPVSTQTSWAPQAKPVHRETQRNRELGPHPREWCNLRRVEFFFLRAIYLVKSEAWSEMRETGRKRGGKKKRGTSGKVMKNPVRLTHK